MHHCLHIALCISALALPAVPSSAADLVAASSSATDADIRVPETQYNSAFTGYQPFREQKLAPWRELNDDVHTAGGHIGIFSGAAGARAAPAQAPSQHPPEQKK